MLLGGPRKRLGRRNAAKIIKLDAMIARYLENIEDQQSRLEQLMGEFHTGNLTKGTLHVRKEQIRYKLRGLHSGLRKLRRLRLNLERASREEGEEEAEDEAIDTYLDQEEEREARKEARRLQREKVETPKAVGSTKAVKKKATSRKRTGEDAKVFSFTRSFVSAYRTAAKESQEGKALDLVRTYPYSVTYLPHKGEHLVLFCNPKSERLETALLPEGNLDLSQHGRVIRTCFLDVGDWSEAAAARAAADLLLKDLS